MTDRKKRIKHSGKFRLIALEYPFWVRLPTLGEVYAVLEAYRGKSISKGVMGV